MKVINLFLVTIFSLFFISAASTPPDITALAAAGGRLFAGTLSGKIYVSGDSGLQWTDVSAGLCDTAVPFYRKAVGCMKVTGKDSIHAVTRCGEFVLVQPEVRWTRLTSDSCLGSYCQACMNDTAIMNSCMISSFLTGPIEWSNDGGKTWTIAVAGCSVCSMPIVECLYFDSVSALAGLYGNYSSMIGFKSSIIVSKDSGRIWKETNFSGIAVRSLTRIGAITFAATDTGLYASRDDFSTWWVVGATPVGLSRVTRTTSAKTGDGIIAYSLTGQKLLSGDHRKVAQAVLERRNGASVLRIRVMEKK